MSYLILPILSYPILSYPILPFLSYLSSPSYPILFFLSYSILPILSYPIIPTIPIISPLSYTIPPILSILSYHSCTIQLILPYSILSYTSYPIIPVLSYHILYFWCFDKRVILVSLYSYLIQIHSINVINFYQALASMKRCAFLFFIKGTGNVVTKWTYCDQMTAYLVDWITFPFKVHLVKEVL